MISEIIFMVLQTLFIFWLKDWNHSILLYSDRNCSNSISRSISMRGRRKGGGLFYQNLKRACLILDQEMRIQKLHLIFKNQLPETMRIGRNMKVSHLFDLEHFFSASISFSIWDKVRWNLALRFTTCLGCAIWRYRLYNLIAFLSKSEELDSFSKYKH